MWFVETTGWAMVTHCCGLLHPLHDDALYFFVIEAYSLHDTR